MSYLGYVVAAYAVFVVVMAWDWLAPQLQIRHALRQARLRAAREATRAERAAGRTASEELIR
ncbi:heme exporter protein CcmD [Marilutibacter chinensis]|uniref:Heme exporter protein D n=1 Tax=Marilutibacter chinensis TaxID=2912247 RepID=A0ABS9HPY3_9GAMM|nr:heme exporter protein CcmD [Lysobacter chinensis]MCF7220187.1 heme exporter protein CcmD [Lysobacter chinensis]